MAGGCMGGQSWVRAYYRPIDSFASRLIGLAPSTACSPSRSHLRSLDCILPDQFLAEVRGLKYKNVAAELLAKLLGDEIKVRSKRNLVQSREFSEMLKKTLNKYHNRAIATQEVIEELIKLAKEMSAAGQM